MQLQKIKPSRFIVEAVALMYIEKKASTVAQHQLPASTAYLLLDPSLDLTGELVAPEQTRLLCNQLVIRQQMGGLTLQCLNFQGLGKHPVVGGDGDLVRTGITRMLADISGQQLDYRTGGDVGPALGAARLAQLAQHKEAAFSDLLPQLPLEQAHRPDAERFARYAPRRETFRQIYQQLLPLMSS